MKKLVANDRFRWDDGFEGKPRWGSWFNVVILQLRDFSGAVEALRTEHLQRLRNDNFSWEVLANDRLWLPVVTAFKLFLSFIF
jgi:hypothetical protein